MATFLDIGVLGYFSIIFTLILVFVIMYGFLSWTKPFGEKNTGLYALIAFAFGVLSITSKGVLTLITFMTPWFFVMIFIGFFILFILMMFGLKSEDLIAGKTSQFRIWPIIFTIVILLFGLGAAFGQDTLVAGTGGTQNNPEEVQEEVPPAQGGNVGSPSETATGDFGSNVLNTLINPKVLGMIVVMLVGVFAMFFLTTSWLDT